MKRVLTSAVALLSWIVAVSQQVSVAFYNVENLYDTVPSLFYDDSSYTPCGAYRWNTERYMTKVRGLSRVLDDMSADLVGLAEVENIDVVRDVVGTSHSDYCFVHRTGNDARGMDLALLYKGDKFEPISVELLPCGSARELLYVRGRLYEDTVSVVVCHLPSIFNSAKVRRAAFDALSATARSLREAHPSDALLVVGDMNAAACSREIRGLGFDMHFADVVARGCGSYYVNGGWTLIDNIFFEPPLRGGQGFCVVSGAVFAKRYMLCMRDGARVPFRTFERGRYQGGTSDHLPVLLLLQK